MLGEREQATGVAGLAKRAGTAHKVVPSGGERRQAVPPTRSLLGSKEAVRGRGGKRRTMRGKELPLVLSKGHSKVTALAGSIWALAGGE